VHGDACTFCGTAAGLNFTRASSIQQDSQLNPSSEAAPVDSAKEHVKQVIVVRRDLNMRLGKAIAQGAHAAMMFMIRDIAAGRESFENVAFEQWLEQGITKICVRADSEAELNEIFAQAKAAGLRVEIIRDAGRTEFAGPTLTALAIGPDLARNIDAITGHLKPYKSPSARPFARTSAIIPSLRR